MLDELDGFSVKPKIKWVMANGRARIRGIHSSTFQLNLKCMIARAARYADKPTWPGATLRFLSVCKPLKPLKALTGWQVYIEVKRRITATRP